MKLYKFKSIDPYEYFLDILENQRLYCSEYRKLNDPSEGILGVIPDAPNGSVNHGYINYLANLWDQHFEKLKKYRVCSLTEDNQNILLWSHYSAGLQGVCIEFEIPDDINDLYKVNYIPDVLSLSIEKPIEYLTSKLCCWSHEKEYRFITTENYVDMKNRITGLFVGERIKENPQYDFIMNYIINYTVKNRNCKLSTAITSTNGTIKFT